MKPRKLSLDLASLRVETFAPVHTDDGRGTVLGHGFSDGPGWLSCATSCNCPSPNTFDLSCDCPPVDTSPETGC